jgi:hypothetical protein
MVRERGVGTIMARGLAEIAKLRERFLGAVYDHRDQHEYTYRPDVERATGLDYEGNPENRADFETIAGALVRVGYINVEMDEYNAFRSTPAGEAWIRYSRGRQGP